MLALAVSVAALDTPGRSQQIADGAAADPAISSSLRLT